MTDCDFTTGSYGVYGNGLPLTTNDMKWFFRCYAAESEWRSPDISPLRADNVSGMPRTIIATAQYDVLRDEGEAYAQKMRDAGVAVTLRRLIGLTHGFIRLHNLFDVPRDELKAVASEIRAAGAARRLRQL